MALDKKFIVWDWNGTIIADEVAAFKAFNETLLFRNKQPILMEDWREAFDMPLQQFYINVGFSHKDLDQHLTSMSVVFHKHFEEFASTSPLRQGWKETVAAVGERFFDNVILSNHLLPSIHHHATRLGIADQFDYILAHADQAEQLSKLPKSERLRLHMHRQQLSAQNALIIGDTPEEAHIGRQLGIVSILMTGGYATQRRLEAATPDYLIHSLDELCPILHQCGFVS